MASCLLLRALGFRPVKRPMLRLVFHVVGYAALNIRAPCRLFYIIVIISTTLLTAVLQPRPLQFLHSFA